MEATEGSDEELVPLALAESEKDGNEQQIAKADSASPQAPHTPDENHVMPQETDITEAQITPLADDTTQETEQTQTTQETQETQDTEEEKQEEIDMTDKVISLDEPPIAGEDMVTEVKEGSAEEEHRGDISESFSEENIPLTHRHHSHSDSYIRDISNNIVNTIESDDELDEDLENLIANSCLSGPENAKTVERQLNLTQNKVLSVTFDEKVTVHKVQFWDPSAEPFYPKDEKHMNMNPVQTSGSCCLVM